MNKKAYFMIIPVAFLCIALLGTFAVLQEQQPTNQGLQEILLLKSLRQKTDYYSNTLEKTLQQIRPYTITLNQDIVTINANLPLNDTTTNQLRLYSTLINDTEIQITPQNLSLNKKSIISAQNSLKITNINFNLETLSISINSQNNITTNTSTTTMGVNPISVSLNDNYGHAYAYNNNIDFTGASNLYTFTGSGTMITIQISNNELTINSNQNMTATITLDYNKKASAEYSEILTIQKPDNIKNTATITLKN